MYTALTREHDFFRFLTPCILMIFSGFSDNVPRLFSLRFGIDLETILDRLGVNFWSSWRSEGRQKASMIDARIGIEKSSFLGGLAPRKHPWLVPGGVPPLGPGKPSPGPAPGIRQCTRASFGIVFASFLDYLQFLVEFRIDRKKITKRKKSKSSKTHSQSQQFPQMEPNLSLLMDLS